MSSREPDSDAGRAFGETGRPTARGGIAARLRAAGRYVGGIWEELLSEQGIDEAIDARQHQRLRGGRSGWPYTPKPRIFRRCPQCGRRLSRCRCSHQPDDPSDPWYRSGNGAAAPHERSER